jgi:hypothetical protein
MHAQERLTAADATADANRTAAPAPAPTHTPHRARLSSRGQIFLYLGPLSGRVRPKYFVTRTGVT